MLTRLSHPWVWQYTPIHVEGCIPSDPLVKMLEAILFETLFGGLRVQEFYEHEGVL